MPTESKPYRELAHTHTALRPIMSTSYGLQPATTSCGIQKATTTTYVMARIRQSSLVEADIFLLPMSHTRMVSSSPHVAY
jgi:hypothetical protein